MRTQFSVTVLGYLLTASVASAVPTRPTKDWNNSTPKWVDQLTQANPGLTPLDSGHCTKLVKEAEQTPSQNVDQLTQAPGRERYVHIPIDCQTYLRRHETRTTVNVDQLVRSNAGTEDPDLH